ncbi:MAG: ubiquinone biosynthesis protein COQ7 [Lachnospiraceae bacterium]|jgi:rubrerythrin|uniref:ubiquinone biosynthesis protein COQ7 n=1 Tax=Mitsuokella multacida TaxID=52226 RepID=UPI0022E33138|nr:ubiquinone biosynthesis protein COQ7 [Mitsuokella multacida]MCH4034052.1 ubiquinone biosynthesis protein COQ7 [Lachnospiraceae bacterium]MDD5850069.1 ubiquinone biosynthesis protein COQ7 [Bacillota bacterium]
MFGNPFSANVERKMTKEELVQAIRADLSGELEAIYGYDAHVQATDDPVAKAVLSDIRDEEKAHMGELLTLLKYLDPKEGDLYASGEREVLEMLEELGIRPAEIPGTDSATVGSMKEE